ncbi:MAG TPA: hypothetical protein VES02_09695 [Dermatophilaceae bacterium]|nr:hypothetical protein [Dermatophilaceae bacterium]
MTRGERSVRLWALVTGVLLTAGLLLPSQAHADDAAVVPSPEPTATAVAAPVDQSAEQPAVAVEQVSAAVSVPKAAGPRGRLAVGDSLMVSVTPWMTSQGFRVHAKVGRQFSTAPGIVRSFGSKLPRNVVVELGTNGTVSRAACRSVIETAGKYRRVFLVTARVPRSWEAGNIRTLNSCDASYAAKRVRIIDWHSHSAGHPEWFVGDRVHLSSSGRQAFQRLIDAEVDRQGLR